MPQLDRSDQVRVAFAVSAALSAASWLMSLCWLSPLYAMTTNAAFSPFQSATMHCLYTFAAVIFAAVVAPTMTATSILLRDKSPFNEHKVWEMRALRRVTIFIGGCFLVVLIVANADAFGYEKRVTSHEAEFSAKFNAFYCNLRGLQICTEGENFAKLQEMLGHVENETSTLKTAENVWNYCRVQIASHDGLLLTRDKTFLKSCNASGVGDNWCGYSALGLPTNGSSPFLENPGMFEFFRTEWPKRVWFDSFLLGFSLGCAMLVALLTSNGEIKSQETNEKFDLVEEKMAQEMRV